MLFWPGSLSWSQAIDIHGGGASGFGNDDFKPDEKGDNRFFQVKSNYKVYNLYSWVKVAKTSFYQGYTLVSWGLPFHYKIMTKRKRIIQVNPVACHKSRKKIPAFRLDSHSSSNPTDSESHCATCDKHRPECESCIRTLHWDRTPQHLLRFDPKRGFVESLTL